MASLPPSRPPFPQPHKTARKVPIPRLENRRPSRPSETGDSSRVSRACTNCRRRKVKCTAARPSCKTCLEQGIDCVYPLARRDRLATVAEQRADLVRLVKDLSVRADHADKEKISALLETVEADDDLVSSPVSSPTVAKRPKVGSGQHVEEEDSDSALSAWDIGSERNDWGKRPSSVASSNSRETSTSRGDLPETAGMHPHHNVPNPEDLLHISDPAFDLDISDNILADVMVDPLELPAPAEARRLLDLYMDSIHLSFPLISRVAFEEHMFACYQSGHVPEKQKGILNLIFAIASYRSSIGDVGYSGNKAGHLMYQARARLLGLKNVDFILTKPDLELVQLTGLLSLYYLTIGHASRAWLAIGISSRFAQLLGLHLKADGSWIDPTDNETRARTWWSLRAIEFRLSALTARPSVISDRYCSIPPITAAHERTSSADAGASLASGSSSRATSVVFGKTSNHAPLTSFLRARLRVGYITQKVMAKLYSPRTTSTSWESIQQTTASLKRELDAWATVVLGAPSSVGTSRQSWGQRDRVNLELYHCSTMILVTRLCLHRYAQHFHSSNTSFRSFDEKYAEECIQAAKRITSMLPDKPSPGLIYDLCPFWSITHYMTQALTVFLEVLTYEKERQRWDFDVTGGATKLLQWLRAMKTGNLVAEKAYKVAFRMLEKAAGLGNLFIYNLLRAEQTKDVQATHMLSGTTKVLGYRDNEPQTVLPPPSAPGIDPLNSGVYPAFQSGFGPSEHQDATAGFLGLDSWGAEPTPMDSLFLMDLAFDQGNDPQGSSAGLLLDHINAPYQQHSAELPLHPLSRGNHMTLPASAPYLRDPEDNTPTEYH